MQKTKLVAEPGRVVKSIAGRDAGKYFVIYTVDGVYCTIVDGRYHKSARPKKKKQKHLRLTENMLGTIAEKWAADKKVFDSEIAGKLKEFNETEQTGSKQS